MERLLLAFQFRFQRGLFGLQDAQPSDIRPVRRPDKVRQHMHLTERLADDRLVRQWMRQRCPVGARDITGLHGVMPHHPHRIGRGRPCKSADRQLVAMIQRLLQLACGLIVLAGETDGNAMQFVVVILARDNAGSAQRLAQLVHRQACADDGAVQVAVELPDLRSPRDGLAPHQRRRDAAQIERPQRDLVVRRRSDRDW